MAASRNTEIVVSQGTVCSGCGVCAAVCQSGAITMELGAHGFYVPITNAGRCTDCGLCKRVCPWGHEGSPEKALRSEVVDSYAAYSTDDAVRQHSSSGGVGFELASRAMSQGYSACGVRYNTVSRRAEHFTADTISGFLDSRGSKYIPSYTVDAFCRLFDGGRYIVFGTPCQILALRRAAALKEAEEKLVLVDFFCHGVPSYHLWNYYSAMVEEYLGARIRTVVFRDKRYGWREYTMAVYSDRQLYVSQCTKGDLFYELFLGDLCLNEPCYNHCYLRGSVSAADIRLGDCWSADYAEDDKGTSICVVYTHRGREAAAWLRASCSLRTVPVGDLIRGQIVGGLRKPRARGSVLSDLRKHRSPVLLRLKYVIPSRNMRRLRTAWRSLRRTLRR